MKYWFKNSPKYHIAKPCSAEGWAFLVGYFVLAVITVYFACIISRNGEDIITFMIFLVVGLLVESLAFSFVREMKTDPASLKVASPKIKGGKKKKMF